MTQNELLQEVVAERAAQDQEWGGRPHDDGHGVAEWVALLARHVGLAMNDGATTEDPVRFRRQMVRVAAVALAALEAFERRCPGEK